METKKSKKANLESLRTIFIQVGIILSLIAVLAAFEWKSNAEFKPIVFMNSGIDISDVDIPITRPVEEKKVIAPIAPTEKLIIVGDKDIIVDEPFFLDTEVNWDDAIDLPIFAKKEEVVEEPIYYNVQVYPKFMGKDDNAFRKYIIDNIKFPIEAQENGLTGKVQVQFVVDLDGSLSNIKILRSIHPTIDREVLRVVQQSPKWEPAIQAGRYVRAMYGIVITFELQ